MTAFALITVGCTSSDSTDTEPRPDTGTPSGDSASTTDQSEWAPRTPPDPPPLPPDPQPACEDYSPGVCVQLTGDQAYDWMGVRIAAADMDADGDVEVALSESVLWGTPLGYSADAAVFVVNHPIESGPVVGRASWWSPQPDRVAWFGSMLGLHPGVGQVAYTADINDDRYVRAFELPFLDEPASATPVDAFSGAVVTPPEDSLFSHNIIALGPCDLPQGGGLAWCMGNTDVGLAEYPSGDQSGQVIVYAAPLQQDVPHTNYVARYCGDLWERADQFDGGADFDNDGQGDLVIGAYASLGVGRVAVITDPPAGDHRVWDVATAILSGTHPGGVFGERVTTGDLDGDGSVDVLTAAPIVDESYVFAGPHEVDRSASEADWMLSGSDWLGTAQVVGDFDADGRMDWAVSASNFLSADQPGTVYLFLDPEPGSYQVNDADAALQSGVGVRDWFGTDLVTGDFDGDGRTDLIVGAPRDPTAGEDAGAVYILLGGGL